MKTIKYKCIKSVRMRDGDSHILTGDIPFIKGMDYIFHSIHKCFFCKKTSTDKNTQHYWTRNNEFFKHFMLYSKWIIIEKRNMLKFDNDINIIAAMV